MEITREDILKQIERATEDHHASRVERLDTRKWGVTTWAVSIVALVSGKLELSDLGTLGILAIPIAVFWFFEMVISAYILRRERFIQNLELRLAHGNFKVEDAKEIYPYLAEHQTSDKDRFHSLRQAFVTRRRPTLLYAMLIILSIIFSLNF